MTSLSKCNAAAGAEACVLGIFAAADGADDIVLGIAFFGGNVIKLVVQLFNRFNQFVGDAEIVAAVGAQFKVDAAEAGKRVA